MCGMYANCTAVCVVLNTLTSCIHSLLSILELHLGKGVVPLEIGGLYSTAFLNRCTVSLVAFFVNPFCPPLDNFN